MAHGAGVDKKSERTAEYVEAHRAHTEHANYLKNDKSPTTMAEVETRGTGARRWLGDPSLGQKNLIRVN